MGCCCSSPYGNDCCGCYGGYGYQGGAGDCGAGCCDSDFYCPCCACCDTRYRRGAAYPAYPFPNPVPLIVFQPTAQPPLLAYPSTIPPVPTIPPPYTPAYTPISPIAPAQLPPIRFSPATPTPLIYPPVLRSFGTEPYPSYHLGPQAEPPALLPTPRRTPARRHSVGTPYARGGIEYGNQLGLRESPHESHRSYRSPTPFSPVAEQPSDRPSARDLAENSEGQSQYLTPEPHYHRQALSNNDLVAPVTAHHPPLPPASPRLASMLPPVPNKSPRHANNLRVQTDLPLPGAATPGERRARRLSSTEMFFPNPELAKEAMESERQFKRSRRRAPTPFVREEIHRVGSDRSLRSRVSFDSGRRSAMSDRSVDTDVATVGAYEPPFGAAQGVGPAGEAIEYIGLGSKTPRHRKFSSVMLKSAMRSSSRVNSCIDLPDSIGGSRSRSTSRASHRSADHSPTRPGRSAGDEHGQVPQHHEQPSLPAHTSGTRSGAHGNNSTRSRTGRPTSTLPFSSNIFSLGRVHSRHASQPVPGHIHAAGSNAPDHLAPVPQHQTHNRQHRESVSSTSQAAGALRTILGNLSLEQRRHPIDPPDLLKPADDLHSYLSSVEYTNWARWPALPNRGIFGTRSKGFDAMGWEWRRRLQDAEQARGYRALRMWDVNKSFEREALQFHNEHTPAFPIDFQNRWGKQIFALPAEGYETLEFFDEDAAQSPDHGLLSWLTNSLFATATSALHMMRYASQPFAFHLVPAPHPPGEAPYVDSRGRPKHCLWEGFGTLALVNKAHEDDRAMIVEVRPPSVVDSGVLREFVRPSRSEGWWHFPNELCVGDVGQANLLQAQVYDACVNNHVFYFAVTNIKYWVFGRFNGNFSMCTVSPIIDRKQKGPSVMQCLTAWVVRSVDERPNADNPHIPQPDQLMSTPPMSEAPAYTDRLHQSPTQAQPAQGSFSTLASTASPHSPLTPQGAGTSMGMGQVGFMPMNIGMSPGGANTMAGYPKYPPGYYDLPPTPFAAGPGPSSSPASYQWPQGGYGNTVYGWASPGMAPYGW